MVLVITQHNLPKPSTDLATTIMLPALKLSLNGFQLRDHPLLSRNPRDDKSSAAPALPTVMGEAQKREGFWFSLSSLLPVSGRESPELDQSCLVRV